MNTLELTAIFMEITASILIVVIGLILLRRVNSFIDRLTKHFDIDEIRSEPKDDMQGYNVSVISTELLKEKQALTTQETHQAKQRIQQIDKYVKGGWLQFGDSAAEVFLKSDGELAIEQILKALLDIQYPHLNLGDAGLQYARSMKMSLERTLTAFVDLGYITGKDGKYRATNQGREFFEKALHARMAFDEKFLSLYSSPRVMSTGCHDYRCRFVIEKDSDDASEVSGGSTCTFSADDENIYLGKCYHDEPITAGFRFVDIDIPANVTIEHAYLEFVADGPYANNLSLAIYAEDHAELGTFRESDQPKDRPMTELSVAWQLTSSEPWQLGQTRRTPDISILIQHIVDTPNWAQGNSLAILIRGLDTGDRGAHRRLVGYHRAKLSQEYQPPSLIIEYDPVSNQGATKGM